MTVLIKEYPVAANCQVSPFTLDRCAYRFTIRELLLGLDSWTALSGYVRVAYCCILLRSFPRLRRIYCDFSWTLEAALSGSKGLVRILLVCLSTDLHDLLRSYTGL